MKTALLILFLLLPARANAQFSNILKHPIEAKVIRVIDGDTIVVNAQIWLKQTVETSVRLRDIDAPELRGGCKEEKELAIKAKEFVEEATGELVTLKNVGFGKFAGRVLADVILSNGKDLAELLLENNLARLYQGDKRQSWCN